MKRNSIFSLLSSCAAAVVATGQEYELVRLVDLPAVSQSWAMDVNESGQVVGSVMAHGWKRTLGFVWQDGAVMEQIIPTPGDRFAMPPQIGRPDHHVEATTINDAGVVGSIVTIFSFGRFTGPSISPLPPRDEWPDLVNVGVLSNSNVTHITSTDPMLCVGWGWYADLPQFPRRAFAAVVTTADGVGDPPRFERIAGFGDPEAGATAHAANSAWTIVGGVQMADGRLNAYQRTWDTKVVLPMGTLGGPSSEALDINDPGQIVGWAHTEPGRQHAFLYEGGRMTDLGTLGGPNSTARAINNRGQIVGEAWTAGGEVHAFVFENGVMRDLNDMIPAGTGWILQRAHGINESGWIVGEGWIDGESHAFLLVPGGCPADIDGDGDADVDDFFTFLDLFAAGDDRADFNNDGTIDVDDFFAFLDAFAAGCG